jgi:glycosyltransferase involved in cell wall biosynthesis
MKLLYITNSISEPGGLERVLSVKTSYFIDNFNYDVHIIILNKPEYEPFYRFNKKVHIHNISLKQNIFGYLKKYIFGLRKVVKDINPDIISVCDDGIKGLYVPLYLFKKKCPIIYERHVSKNVTINGNNEFFKNNILLFVMNFGAKMFDRFVVLTTDNVEEWKHLKNIEIIPNPLPLLPQQTNHFRKKQIISIGRLVYQKGFDYLIEIWSRIYEKYPDWSLHIYGKGPDKKDLLLLIKRKGLSRIEIHDPITTIEEIYNESSIYTLTSRYEGFGMVLIEAMAYGIPCISFDCPCGPKDIIDSDTDGFLIKTFDIDSFSNKLVELINNKDIRIRMGKAAQQKILKHYHPEKICNIWDILFNKLLK